MDKIFNAFSIFFAVTGGLLAGIFGEWDTVLWTLTLLMALDYITGIIKAVYKKQVSSEIGFKGILKKITVLAVVALANAVQVLIGGNQPVREMVIMFYIANEGISVLENASEVLPNMPAGLKNILLQIRNKDKQRRI